MVGQTGLAILKINHDGKKCWYTTDDSSKDAYMMCPKECVEFNPEAFDEGAEIRIFETIKT